MNDFVHLHVHSFYSMMSGVSSPEALCREARKAGFTHLALTDTNGFYGLINFLEAARANGIEPIVGVEIKTPQTCAVILARTAAGYEILSDLITRRHIEDDFSLVRSLPEKNSDIVLLSADPELIKALRNRLECFFEIVPGPSDRELLQTAKEIGIAPVATNAVHFAAEEGYPLHRLVRAIALNKTLGSLAPEDTAPPGRRLKSAREMSAHFPNCPEALANTVKIAKACHTAWDRFQTVFPHYLDKNEDHFALLLSECRRGIGWRYGKTGRTIEDRLAEELDLIRSKGFVDYFLVVADIVRRRPIHCGRGSGAASLVSYLLGITHVDPIRHNLLFSRFLNPERKDLPDIDVDFPWDERDGLFEEIMAHYGSQRLALVSNHVGFRARASVRETAKVYGVPASEIKEVTRRMNYWTSRGGEVWEHIKSSPKFHNFPLDPPWPEIIDLSSRLESVPRNIGTHCGGMVLVPDRVSRYVPVQISAKGTRIIQWEKDQAEKAGLVKIDLLGNRSLAVIRDAIESIRDNTGTSIYYPNFNPVDDLKTREIISRGKTMGVFYLESPAMRLLQQKAGTGDFEHAVIHSSIIRPAANRFIREYLRRLHGEPYEPLHPSLKDILAENYGILVYQEDVVQAAMAMAGFSWGEADSLRKVISKKSREQLSDYRVRFAQGCARNGICPEVVEKVWDMFTSFSGYSFCKPHSASYALVSFKSAYLKAHHPAEFMAAVLSNGGGYYSTFAYISEARRMGIEVLGPDINESRLPYTGRGKTIRTGFQQLQAIKKSAIEAILTERNRGGPFSSIEDFVERVKVQSGFPISAADAAILVKSGALDPISGPLNRPQILWFIEARLNALHAPAGTKSRSGPSHDPQAPPKAAPILAAAPPPPSFSKGGAGQYPATREKSGGMIPPHPPDFGHARCAREAERSVLSAAGRRPPPKRHTEPHSGDGGVGAMAPALLESFKMKHMQIAAFCLRSPIKVPDLPDFPDSRKWAHESETLGFPLSVHPLELAEPFFRSFRAAGPQPKLVPDNRLSSIVPASDMAAHVGKKIRMKGWPVTRKEVLTREGEEMEFFTFEDQTGIFETVFFPKPFKRFCQDLDMSHAYLLHGLVESEFDVASLNVDYAYRVPM
jgi:error-prone DNA polymerase